MILKCVGFIIFLVLSVLTNPVTQKKDSENEDVPEGTLPKVEYENYLKQVIELLETDPDFKKKIEALGNESDIMSVVSHLDLVSHNVRTKLDEIKRIELNRLNKMEARLEKLQKTNNQPLSRVDKDHINIINHQNFEEEDLRKLISKTVEIANQLDIEAEKEFRRYQMEKEMMRRLRLSKIKSKEMREKQRLIEEDAQKRHKNHPPIHYPGTEEQLKEVWEKEDKFDRNSFNPVTFFRLHDSNEDGHLDIAEIEAIMQTELKKVYEVNNSDDDLVDMYNEMLRMRKEVFKEADTNKDRMISYPEFIRWTKSEEFKTEKNWQTQDELNETIYSPEEFEKFKKEFKETHPNITFENIGSPELEETTKIL